jgi:hypothetical protein
VGFPGIANTEIFTIDGDTLIESTAYQKIVITEDQSLTNWSFYAALREDSLGKVFLYDPEDSLERLIYDFTLSVGDTFYHKAYNHEYHFLDSIDTMQVYNIDSVLLETGEKRKRLMLSGKMHGFDWIEGLGSPWGLVYDSCAAPHILSYWCGLNCVMHGSTLLYSNDGSGACITDIENELEDLSGVKVYLDPVEQVIHIEFILPPAQPYYLDIFDLQGRRLYRSEALMHSTNHLYSLKNRLLPGIYLYRLGDGKSKGLWNKFIIY